MSFASKHLSNIFKYGGISFIAGAVNHGFFSEQRSLWTAGLGVVFYLIGAAFERRALRADGQKLGAWQDLLGAGIVFSIGIGFFTGGLQHFPDSPERSVWVVPLGFAISLLAFYWMNRRQAPAHKQTQAQLAPQPLWIYGLLASGVVVAASLLTWQVLLRMDLGAPHLHDHDHGHATAQPLEHTHLADDAHIQPVAMNTAAPMQGHDMSAHEPHTHASPAEEAAHSAAKASKHSSSSAGEREIVIEMNDQMRFVPSHLQVKQGETVRFKIINRGKIRHEWVIGTEQELQAHAQQMKQQAAAGTAAHHHGGANALTLAPGEQGTLTWRFTSNKSLGMACFEPGHFEAGMRGTIEVVAPAVKPAAKHAD